MGQIDLEDEEMKMTVGEFIQVIAHLKPELTLIKALGEAQRLQEFWEEKFNRLRALMETITKERNEALEILRGKK